MTNELLSTHLLKTGEYKWQEPYWSELLFAFKVPVFTG
jgi:hypothetical protein